MTLGKQVPDKSLLRSVSQKLMQKAAGGGSKINASVSSGVVTLSGVLAQEHQRRMIMSAMTGISGVKRVIDTMSVAPPRKMQ